MLANVFREMQGEIDAIVAILTANLTHKREIIVVKLGMYSKHCVFREVALAVETLEHSAGADERGDAF